MLKSKKFLVVMVLILILSSFLTGCAQKQAEITAQPQQTQENQQERESKKFVIGISMPNITHPIRRGAQIIAEEWDKAHDDVELIITDAQKDSLKQNNDVEDLISKGVDAVVMSPNQTDAVKPAQEAVLKAGKIMVGYDRALPLDDYDCFVAGDNVEMGRMAARYIVEKIGEKGLVIQLEGTPGSSAAIDRKLGFEEVMKDYPNIKIESYNGDFRRHEAVTIMEDVVQKYDKIDAVFSHNDEMALGAVQVMEPIGMLKDTVIIGSDGQKDALESIKAGKLTATVAYPYHFPEVLDVTYKILKGEKVEKNIPLETPLLDKTNIDKYYDPNSDWWVQPKN